MNNLRQIEIENIALLEPLYGENEARSIVRWLLEEYCGVRAADYVLDPTRKIDTSEKKDSPFDFDLKGQPRAASFDSAMEMCRKWRPVQYTIAHASFCENELYVCEGVLIPRVETEQLVQMILSEIDPTSQILDIGTGSGCIALSLAQKLPMAKVFACDISPISAKVFEINRNLLKVDAEFFEADILKDDLPKCYDVIISNPPYVLDSEREQMLSNVLDYEPELALFVPDDDPLRFYRRIAELATRHLSDGGRLYFEINERFGDQTVAMLSGLGFSQVEACLDIFDKVRIVKALWQSTTNL